MTPLVSILIPCYNAEPWIAETLRSALAQTHPRCEIIVVDDGSSDGSAVVARQFEPAGVRVLQQPNRGASAARNAAFRACRGEWIQFLDADDLLSADKISAQLDLLSRPGNDRKVATCRWGRFRSDPATARFVDQEVFRDFAALDFLILTTSTNRMMHPAAWLISRSVIEAAGTWNETLSLNDDGEFFARVVLASEGIVFSAQGTSLYRSNLAGSLSRTRGRKAWASLHRSVELTTQAMLAAEDSPRVRQAAADFWQHTGYELYPGATDLSQDALRRAKELGGSAVQPCGGARQQFLGRFVGWKLARRLAGLIGRS